MQKVKKDLIKNNQKINWIPTHLKEGRFGEWLREIKDWAISRERYWGTPLPIWRCQMGKSEIRNPKSETNSKFKIPNPKQCDNIVVIGSEEDLLKQKFSTNNYYSFRHGHSLRQVTNLTSCWPEKNPFPLTNKGKKDVLKEAKRLKKEKIDASASSASTLSESRRVDLIFSSDLLRAKQTAEIISKETGAKIIFDKRLRELNVGIFNGKNPKLFWDYISKQKNLCLASVPKGESLMEVRKRVYDFIKEIDKKYEKKNIVIVSHELPLTVLERTLAGSSLEEILKWRKENRDKIIRTAGWRKVEFKNLPFNEKMEIDFHRPYIDEVKFYCQKCGCLMKRIPEVIDCWFDSGSMPFAQGHWPFAPAFAKASAGKQNQKLKPPKLFPADYISEGIDQTRGWFYTLLAISTLLGFGPPYKNVISLGHVLDEKGEKMSKSKGNVVDPWDIVEKYGTDAIRWYFYTVNQPGDSKLFSEKDVEEGLRKFILTFWNCYVFYNTYADKRGFQRRFTPKDISGNQRSYQRKSAVLLDKWIISRLNGLIQRVEESLDKYDVTGAARAIENFVINDLSLWYIRRSRKRFQRPETKKELKEASQTLGFALLTLSKLMAPFIPFLSEQIYQKCSSPGDEHSVHLEGWPKVNKKLIDKKLEEKMEKVREIVALALAERAKAGIKVRQPLSKLKIKNEKLKMKDELLDLIKEEVNVKEIIFGAKIKKEVEIDTKITAELKEEGIIREVMRQIQEMRKKAGLKPRDKILVQCFGTLSLNKILEKNEALILKEVLAKEFKIEAKGKKVFDTEQEIKINQEKVWLGIKKI